MDILIITGTGLILTGTLAVALLALAMAQRVERRRRLAPVASRRPASLR